MEFYHDQNRTAAVQPRKCLLFVLFFSLSFVLTNVHVCLHCPFKMVGLLAFQSYLRKGLYLYTGRFSSKYKPGVFLPRFSNLPRTSSLLDLFKTLSSSVAACKERIESVFRPGWRKWAREKKKIETLLKLEVKSRPTFVFSFLSSPGDARTAWMWKRDPNLLCVRARGVFTAQLDWDVKYEEVLKDILLQRCILLRRTLLLESPPWLDFTPERKVNGETNEYYH